ncbi:hypothetical protein [Ferruginibacter sp. SUN106]|uniref:hypothetical protein n=1 Tax=Ferruginibacter sp. SUN106 TaxID=2978348 RepID=UPI003D35C6CA
MNYQEKFKLTDDNGSYFSQQFDIFITGFRDEDDLRHSFILDKLKSFKGLIYSFDTCENAVKFNYKIEDEKRTLIESEDNKVLIPDLQLLLSKRGFRGANICIDITNLKQGILFLLIKILLKEVHPARLFASYTEPIEYKKKDIAEIGETEEYDLYDKIMGSSNGVPGFTKYQTQNEILLVAPMGFDSQRLQVIYESLKPKILIPVVGFPSFVPGWNLTAIKMNYLVLKNADCFDSIESCAAASPFEMFELLETIFHRNNSNYDIYVSPLGTRPHCLGAAIFVSKFPSAYLIYDFPIEKKYRSEKVLKANIYYLSKYIG